MFGGRLCCLSYIFTYNALLLLLWAFLYEVEASSCDRIILKKVGDTVKLPSCLPTKGVTTAVWNYNNTKVADKDADVTHPQFKGRVDLNLTDFSLTVRKLTLQDSGVFSLVSEVNDKQSPTVFITLQVDEPIMQQPNLTVNSTWHANESCIVVLECRATSDRNVFYNWTVGNQISSGSRLQYEIQPKNESIEVTCTIFNSVSEKSASRTVKCNNETSTDEKKTDLILILSVAAGSLMAVIVVGIAVGVCRHKKRQSGSDIHELTVYADIGDIAPQHGTSVTMKPCSVYETVDNNRVNAFTSAPHTVYDEIQFNRMRNPSVSPYQEVA